MSSACIDSSAGNELPSFAVSFWCWKIEIILTYYATYLPIVADFRDGKTPLGYFFQVLL